MAPQDKNSVIPWLTLVLCLGINVALTAAANTNYVVNLDLPPEERWVEIGKDFPQIYGIAVKMIGSQVPTEFVSLSEDIAAALGNFLPKEYMLELEGMAMATGGKVGDLVALNLLYDITVHCTSIVSQDAEGQIWHARNMDYGFPEELKNLTIAVEFQRENKTVYKTVTWAGYIGILTGVKPNAFSLSIDQRETDRPVVYNAIVALLAKEATPSFVVTRQLFDSARSYADAVEHLTRVVLIAPIYFIVGGAHPGEGAVITRDRLRTLDIWMLDPHNGRWFIVETNFDHWLVAPAQDSRRDAANKGMLTIGQQNITVSNLMTVIGDPHVRQNVTTIFETIYSVVFSAANSDIFDWHVVN